MMEAIAYAWLLGSLFVAIGFAVPIYWFGLDELEYEWKRDGKMEFSFKAMAVVCVILGPMAITLWLITSFFKKRK